MHSCSIAALSCWISRGGHADIKGGNVRCRAVMLIGRMSLVAVRSTVALPLPSAFLRVHPVTPDTLMLFWSQEHCSLEVGELCFACAIMHDGDGSSPPSRSRHQRLGWSSSPVQRMRPYRCVPSILSPSFDQEICTHMQVACRSPEMSLDSPYTCSCHQRVACPTQTLYALTFCC
jgi:hypothetical protein